MRQADRDEEYEAPGIAAGEGDDRWVSLVLGLLLAAYIGIPALGLAVLLAILVAR